MRCQALSSCCFFSESVPNCEHVVLKVHGLYIGLLHGNLLELPGEGRLGVQVLGRDRLVAGLLHGLLVGRAVFLRDGDVVGAVVLLGGRHDIGLRQPADAVDAVEHVLPLLALGEDHHQLLGALADGLELLLGL